MRLRDISLVQSGRHATLEDVERTFTPGDAWYQGRSIAEETLVKALCGELRALAAHVVADPDRPRIVKIVGWTLDDDLDGAPSTVTIRSDMILMWRASEPWQHAGAPRGDIVIHVLGMPHPIVIRLRANEVPLVEQLLEGAR